MRLSHRIQLKHDDKGKDLFSHSISKSELLYRRLVFSTLLLIHSSNFCWFRGTNRTLKGFGWVTMLVGTELHSMVSKIGRLLGSVVSRMWNARTNRLKIAYNSRFARWAPAHMRVPAP